MFCYGVDGVGSLVEGSTSCGSGRGGGIRILMRGMFDVSMSKGRGLDTVGIENVERINKCWVSYLYVVSKRRNAISQDVRSCRSRMHGRSLGSISNSPEHYPHNTYWPLPSLPH